MSYETKIIHLKGHRTLLACYSMAPRASHKWVVFLPESGSEFRHGDRQELVGLIGSHMAKKYNFLVINKPGVEADHVDKKVFEKSFRHEKRIQDALQTLKEVIPPKDKIHLIGYSEGAYNTPVVARKDKRIVSIAMIGGGTRGWLKEELSNASPKEKPSYERAIKSIYKKPKSKNRWNGFSYATWYSYRSDNTLRALKGLNIPAVAILGARDKVIDLKSAIVDLVLVSERKPIQVHIFGDCGHHFTKHWKPVSRVLSRFLSEQERK
jgi:pimeloyl-ACP methyl ester carboxylesterase